ncbi:uncharacterized protein LOC115923573 isoform X1 [Strongylocentrotus purpuratus]|uniref:Uncharacterized protein n=1 Tax=Strongylocentrotus purpuratus TaxID=7668 RepID=A0A7M7NWJ3_STRPU|nr:uncharacterized protein LOC115923573 isoform X1 [Strongylocentrotus purpuratus]
MFNVLIHSLTGGFEISILLISIILVNLYGCKSTQLSKIEGQEANLIFPYPCDSTEVTLQHSYRVPFYRSSDGSSLSLSQDQVQRLQVQNRNNTDNCYLEFTINNLLSIDQGTYISSVYKDGEILVEQTHRIWLQVDFPPGKASCVVSEDKGGDWVSIDCTANIGSLSGEFECYQDGVWMPPLSDPSHTNTLLKQTILIKKSQPVFCCSSTLDEYKERCECKDTGLYITDDVSNNPCPPLSEITTMPLLSTLTENNQSDYYSTMTSSIPINTKHCKSNKGVIILLILLPIEVIVLILSLFFHYKIKTKIRNDNNGKDRPIPLQLNTSLLNGQKMENGSRKNSESV